MKSILITVTVLLFSLSNGAINVRESFQNANDIYHRGTLDSVKIIKQLESGKCLIIENGKRQGYVRENQVVLWQCHDQKIKGLEQEMFSLTRATGGGYVITGNAGDSNKCVSAEKGYNDHVLVRKCNVGDEDQSWLLRRVDHSNNFYQIVHMSTGRCIRSPGVHDGAWVRVGDCDISDTRQIWMVCGLNGSCEF